MKNQQGFTLIELVVVIVILGILAAVAVPKFIDLSSDAQEAATEGIKGGLSSASAINYAARAVRGSGGDGVIDTTGGCINATAEALLTEFDTVTYTIDYATDAALTDATEFGQSWECEVSDGTNAFDWILFYAN